MTTQRGMHSVPINHFGASKVVLVIKGPLAKAGDVKRHGLGRSPRGGHGNSFQSSCLENPMDRGAWQSTVSSVT